MAQLSMTFTTSTTMQNRFNNFLASLQTYSALSPDLKLRRQVNRSLRQRSALTLDAWFESHCQPHGVTYAVAQFAYEHLANYSGLDFARVRPDDRLDAELYWTQVCWFDWEQRLSEDFWQQFGVDISDSFDASACSTVQDLVVWLNGALAEA